MLSVYIERPCVAIALAEVQALRRGEEFPIEKIRNNELYMVLAVVFYSFITELSFPHISL